MAKVTWLVKYPSETDPVDAWVAHMREVKAELRRNAFEGGARARAILSAHHHAGHARITVTKGTKLDWFVNLDDSRSGPEEGGPAAAAIELGRSGGPSGAMQGIHAIGRAFP